jgi:hypothetical protein
MSTISKEDYDKIYPGDHLVNHKEFKKHIDTSGIYSPFVLSMKLGNTEWMGSYNYAPTGFREVSLEEFAQKQFDGFPILHEQRQLFHENDGTKLERMIPASFTFYSGDCGYAMERDYWKKTVRYYLFEKCKHNWVYTRNLGRCYNEYQCDNCGAINAVDSGD